MDEDRKKVEVSIDKGTANSTDSNVALGKGLDVGTANFVSAIQDSGGDITIKMQRNAFIDVEADDFTRNMLTKLNV